MRPSLLRTLPLAALTGAPLFQGCHPSAPPGTEIWTWWLDGAPVARERRQWSAGGEALEVHLQIGPGPPSEPARWRRQGDAWLGPGGNGYWAEELPPGPMEGPLPLIQLTTGEVRWSLVEPTADGRIVHAEVAPLHLRMREAQVVGWRQARLEGRPGEAGQPLVDPAPLLELPASPLPDPRRQRRVTFRIGGEEHQVEGLLAVEISRVEPLPPAQASGPWADEVERARTASRSTWELAHRLMALASRRVRPTPVRAQGPTQTWLTGRGDCSERAALLVALAQSAGLTASVVEGLVYLDDPPRMAPHAWAELVLGGQVVPVDPTLGQLPADATHLPAPARQVARWCLDGEPVLAVGEPRRGG